MKDIVAIAIMFITFMSVGIWQMTKFNMPGFLAVLAGASMGFVGALGLLLFSFSAANLAAKIEKLIQEVKNEKN